MRRLIGGLLTTALVWSVVRRRRAARAERLLWDEAATAPRVVRDLR